MLPIAMADPICASAGLFMGKWATTTRRDRLVYVAKSFEAKIIAISDILKETRLFKT